MVFVPREDTEAEIATLESGEGLAAYPQAFPGAQDRLTDPIAFVAGGSIFFEGLWPNQRGPESGDLLSNRAVREALLYALDREAIAEVALGPIIDDPEVLHCAGWVPTMGDWCDVTDFADAVQDFDRVTEILEADGWSR